MKIRVAVGALLGMTALLGCAASPPPACPERAPTEVVLSREEATEASERAFQFLQSLSGTWIATVDGKETEVTFEMAAGGHVVIQKGELAAIYHLDGPTVKLLFFPVDGYQAVLKSKGFLPTGKGAEVQFYFDMASASNVAGGSPRVLRLVFSKDADDKIVQTWSFRERRLDSSVVVTMRRKNPPRPVTPP